MGGLPTEFKLETPLKTNHLVLCVGCIYFCAYIHSTLYSHCTSTLYSQLSSEFCKKMREKEENKNRSKMCVVAIEPLKPHSSTEM